jgi:DNA processing protein
MRSGSLITARLATEQGREVFAVPGSIHNPLARGCHSLIKEGAKLVETASDIVEELLTHLPRQPLATATQQQTQTQAHTQTSNTLHSWQQAEEALDPDHARLLDCLSSGPAAVDSLVEQSGLTAEAVSSMLLILELRGLVASQSGGLYARIR